MNKSNKNYMKNNECKNKHSHGALANRSGGTLEHLVISLFTNLGFIPMTYKDYLKNREHIQYKELLLRNVPYPSIYGHMGKTEFLLTSEKHKLQIRIECKWQQVAGSVDEKLPYLFLNCANKMPEKEIIILIDGGGFKDGALWWLKEACNDFNSNNKRGKVIKVMNMQEFIVWVNTTF